MLAHYSLARQFSVLFPLFLTQLSPSRLLLWSPALAVQLLYALIASVSQAFYFGVYSHPASLEEPEIVFTALTCRDADNLTRLLMNYELRLMRVAFLLPAVVFPLFF